MRTASLLCVFILFVSVFGNKSFELVSIQVPERFLPGEAAKYEIKLKNTGDETWKRDEVSVVLELVAWNENKTSFRTERLRGETHPNGEATIRGNFKPEVLGLYHFEVTLHDNQGYFGSAFRFQTEQTCSDGIFCNGVERYVRGKCIKGKNPCPSTSCYTGACDHRYGNCSYVVKSSDPSCPVCDGVICIPDCTGKVCGDDTCGHPCGLCNVGEGCVDGACIPSVGDGSCRSPLELIAGGVAVPGIYTITGDTSGRVNEIVPSCNFRSDAKEMIYKFSVVGTPMGVEARVVGHDTFEDTVLEIRRVCSDPSTTIACSDDSTPPGGLFSRVKALLQPGDYVIFVDGFSGVQQGPYELTVKFATDCMPLCDGSFCGDDSCGGSCGDCDAGLICEQTDYLAYRCHDPSCTPVCGTQQCGDDGCGGECGTCPAGQFCVTEDGSCRAFPSCDHFAPICDGGCKKDEYCGTDCECYKADAAHPDFVVDIPSGVIFDRSFWPESSCPWYERCLGGFGFRRLLRFDAHVINQGFTTWVGPDPKTRPDLYKFSTCHNHWHFSGFANYELLNLDGSVAAVGHKQGYCVEDDDRYLSRPDVPCQQQHDCGAQGISPGWADSYGNSLDCQWIDITGVPPGQYLLQVTANWQRIINELSYENNARAALVTIPHEQSDVLITIDGQSASPDPVTLTQGQTVVFQNTDNVPLQVSWTAGGVTVSYTVKASSYSVLIIFDEIGTFTYTVEQAVGTSNSQPGKGAGKSKAHNGNNNVPVTGTIIVQVVGQAAQRVSTSSMQTAVLSGTGLVMALFGALFVFVAFRYSKRSSEKKPLLEKQELKNIKQ